jgi:predicted nucleic acid-binding protein
MEETESVLTQFDKYPIHLVEAGRRLTYEAAKLKAKYTIAYADCFAAILASSLKALHVTGDPEFKKLSHEFSIEWIVTK